MAQPVRPLELQGLDLQLDDLPEQHRQRSAEEIDQELSDLQRQLAQFDEQLRAAEEIRAAEALKLELERDYQLAQRDLEALINSPLCARARGARAVTAELPEHRG